MPPLNSTTDRGFSAVLSEVPFATLVASICDGRTARFRCTFRKKIFLNYRKTCRQKQGWLVLPPITRVLVLFATQRTFLGVVIE
jgi:hypothetical protein